MITIEPFLIGLVLIAALTHATWNALIKTTGDGLCTFATIMGTGAIICLAAVPFVDFPAPEVLPWLAASTVLHHLYFMFLWYALRHGDLSKAYPVARGASPILVAVGAVVLAGEVLAFQSTVGLVLASFGICLFAFEKGLPRQDQLKPFLLAFVTGIFIASYTVVDGVGLGISETPWGYIVWLTIFNGFPMLFYAIFVKHRIYVEFLKVDGIKIVIGGILAMVGYNIVLYAISFGNMAHISALRETSVLFAVILGAITLKEKFGPIRWIAAITIVIGVATMHVSG